MKRIQRQAGVSAVELIMSATLAVGVLGGVGYMIDASQGVARSTTDAGTASARVGETLTKLADAIRRGSLASARHIDGTNVADATNDTGFQIRAVTAFSGAPVTANLVSYRLDLPPGATEGDLIRTEGAFVAVLASHVTSFRVARAGNLFTLSMSARSGPRDDRGRTSTGSVQVSARNP